ncbi:MAG: Gfo/Idh/MocA family oxidoreductase [Thermoanaerobaculia bacterium]
MTAIRVALVGAGHISGTHLAGWKRTPHGDVVGIFDVDAASAARRAKSYGVARVFESLEEACATADLVDVCTPPHTHPAIVRRAVEAGCDVLVEKPVVTDLADWEGLLPLFEGGSSRLGVIHNLKFTGAVVRAHRWLNEGRIGKLLRLRHEFLTDPSTDRMLAGPHWSHDLPGGRWFETLPHALYLTHFFAGALEPADVVALSTGRDVLGAPADEVAVTLAGESTIATFHYSASCRENRRTLVLEGSDGVLSIDRLADSLLVERRRDSRAGRSLGPLPGGAWKRLLALPRDRGAYLADRLAGRTPHARMIADFAAHVATGAPSPTPLAEVDYVIRTGEAIGRRIDAAAAGGGSRASD